MLVKAKELGYANDRRYREGDVFELKEKDFKVLPDGKIKLPRWVEPVEEQVQPKARRVTHKKVEAIETSSDEVI